MPFITGDYDGNFPKATSLKEELIVFVGLLPNHVLNFGKRTMAFLNFVFEF
jgi:hypothetical protein